MHPVASKYEQKQNEQHGDEQNLFKTSAQFVNYSTHVRNQ